MSKLTVEDTSLVSVANAIRTKGGTTDQLVFPDGFVSAIDGIQSGDGGAFASLVDRSITKVTADMLKGCTTIGNNAFYNCSSLTSVGLPSGVTSLEGNAFGNCSSLTSVDLPSTLLTIGGNAFGNCSSLTSITIPGGVTSIGSNTFSGCKGLASITIPDSVTSIGSNAFYSCKLTSITIPGGVTSIGRSAFSNCTLLTTIEMKPTNPPTLGANAFQNCSSLKQIIVPAGSLSAYKSATNWSAYANKMVERWDLSNVSITLGGA